MVVKMNYYDEQLKQLQSRIAEKEHLETRLADLLSQYEELSVKVAALESKKLAEQTDVDKLEGRSLVAFFYNVVGKMDDRLTKERQEAYEASVKYDVAYRELKAVEENICFHEKSLEKVAKCEQQYEAVLKAKLEYIKDMDKDAASELVRLEEQLIYFDVQKKELREAVLAGQEAQKVAVSILESLSDAEDWGCWDMFGGGLFVDVMKHDSLDEAQAKVEDLQVALRSLKTELADINIQADMQISIEDFLRFADYFFDGLFADWAVMDRIHESQNQVQSTLEQIEEVLSRLEAMLADLEKEQTDTSTELEEKILQISV